ncbi:hypothetical protein RF11_05663 [Thelohanellus kitauei]|uniref:Reverse transcriptase/retrotransposon-derived protein RNase H-like domain-containing protein n=1 Tax=Thelohanellus kitauei TaxID=669202 RepID=A0A0C2NJU9_THEKT|nr:hypothetical protein RF11_05663 [Thelohanellus kitauei]
MDEIDPIICAENGSTRFAVIVESEDIQIKRSSAIINEVKIQMELDAPSSVSIVNRKSFNLLNRFEGATFTLCEWAYVRVLTIHGENFHSCAFATEPIIRNLCIHEGIKAKIILERDTAAYNCKDHPISFFQREIIENVFSDWENKYIFDKTESSDWVSIIVAPLKQDGDVRIYQRPLPRHDEIFSMLASGTRFCFIYHASAYLQMELEENRWQLLTINIHKGMYILTRLFFWLGVDTSVVEKGYRYNFEMNLHPEVECCKLIISEKCVPTSRTKTYAIEKSESPICMEKNRNRIKTFGIILSPLTDLIQKNSSLTEAKTKKHAFQKQKKKLGEGFTLTSFYTDLPMLLATDESNKGIWVVLSRTMINGTERSIAMASSVLKAAEKNYSTIENQFTFVTVTAIDIHPKSRNGLPETEAARIKLWCIFFSAFNFSMNHKSSMENICDANTSSVHYIKNLGDTFLFESIEEESKSDVSLSKMHQKHLRDW